MTIPQTPGTQFRPLSARPGTQERHDEQRTCGHLGLQQMDWKIGWRISHLWNMGKSDSRTLIRLALQIKMLNWAMPLCYLRFPIIQRAKKSQLRAIKCMVL